MGAGGMQCGGNQSRIRSPSIRHDLARALGCPNRGIGMVSKAVVRIALALVSGFLAIHVASAGLSYNAEQTSDGLKYLIVGGEFEYGDDLSHFALAVRTHNPIAVGFNSPGGNISKAMELGRLIRSFRLNTIQPRQAFNCSSACALAFFGGVSRYAEAGAIGVHKSSFSPDMAISAQDAVSAVQQITAEVITYMVEMDVDPSLLQLSLAYESHDVRYLSSSEMRKFRVVTEGDTARATTMQRDPPVASAAPAVTSPPASLLSIPQARTGRVRHPKGVAQLKDKADTKSANIAVLRNGQKFSITRDSDRWYQVNVGGVIGYLHHTWVYVDQFESGLFGHRHIQVKSFDNYAETEAYVRASPIPLAAYLATNGWFAITLDETFAEAVALPITKRLKSERVIPDDAFMTYGNTYVRKVCCR